MGNLEQFTVVALSDLNLREGPGEAFEISTQIPRGYNMTVLDIAKDGGGHKWYKTNIDNGWTKAVYVIQPNSANISKTRVSKNKNVASGFPFGGGGSIGNAVAGIAGSLISGAGVVGALLTRNSGLNASTQERILSRRIYGVPHQFIDTTDGRPDDGGPFGLEFVTNIMAETPILSLLPGVPNYLAGMKSSEKASITEQLAKAANDQLEKAQMDRLNDKELDTKFFEFEPRCIEYMTYVNVLCRMCAIFLGIDKTSVPGYSQYTYGTFNWFRWHLSNAYAGQQAPGSDILKAGQEAINQLGDIVGNAGENLSKAKENFDKNMADVRAGKKSLGDLGIGIFGNSEANDGEKKIKDDMANFKSMNQLEMNNMSPFYMDGYYIDFFIKPPSYSESFQNSTTTSQFANAIQAASGMAKELQFLLGGAMSLNTGKFNEQVGNFTKNQDEFIKSANLNEQVKSMLSRLITGSTSVITGANLIFPEIWDSSQYSRDFSMEITLATPYGTRESVFLNILVPMMHLVAMALPRQVTVNSYSAPFLVRCSVPGFFHCDMGIIRDLAITKGGSEGNSWTKDGLPTEVTITLNIADLYNSLSMSNAFTPKNIWNFIWNGALVDYVGTVCGLNMRSSEMTKKMMVIADLLSTAASDHADYMWGSIAEMSAMARTRVMGAKG